MNSPVSPSLHSFKSAPRLVAVAILAALPLISPVTHAADFSWSAPTNITSDSDVSTNGVLIGAFNVGNIGVPSSTVVNGVNFQGFAAPGGNGTVGNFALASGFSFADNTASGSASAPFANLSANYQAILMSRIAGIANFALTISGLTVGMQYQFQSWTNDSSGNFGYGTSLTGGNNTSDFLSGNVQGMPGGLGQFVTGTFTADSASQIIGYGVDEVAFLNAFQLREIPSSSVPDLGGTGSLLLLALSAFATISLCGRSGSDLLQD